MIIYNMKFDIVDERNKEHLITLLKWLVHEVKSAGGDGDAIWHSNFYSIHAILPLVEELNKDIGWNIDLVKLPSEEEHIWWGANQEGVIITNDIRLWVNRPSWQQCSIQY